MALSQISSSSSPASHNTDPRQGTTTVTYDDEPTNKWIVKKGNNNDFTNTLNEKDVEFGKQWKNASGTPEQWITVSQDNAPITITLTRVRATSSEDSTEYTDATLPIQVGRRESAERGDKSETNQRLLYCWGVC